MDVTLKGSAAFRYLDVTLLPGESLVTEAGAMASMSPELDMQAKLNGNIFSALSRKFLGGESLFVSHFKNATKASQRLTLTTNSPGDVREMKLNGEKICLQPGAYIASTPGVSLGTRWAGIRSFIAREGLFKLEVSGTGTLWYGAYGMILERVVDGEFIVDSSHLVAYEPQIKIRLQLASGIFGSFFSGEGLVTRLEGKGKIYIQTRSLSGLVSWLNPKV